MKGPVNKMEIERDALLRIVKATRMAMRLAENIQKLFVDQAPWSVADEIAGQLADALFMMNCDSAERPFADSMTMRLLKGDLNDEAVTDWFLMMVRIDQRRHQHEESAMPEPQTMSKEEVRAMHETNGGYMTPEGDWK